MLLACVLLALKVILARWLVFGPHQAFAPGLLADLGVVFFLVFMLGLLPERWHAVSLLVLDAVLSVLLLVLVVYDGYFGQLPAASSVVLLPEILPILPIALPLLEPVHALFLIDLPLLALLVFLPKGIRPPSRRLAVTAAASAAAVAIGMTAALLDPLAPLTAQARDAGFLPAELVHTVGALRSAARPTLRPEVVRASAERLGPQETGPDPFAGVAKGRNVILIQVESMQAFPIGRTLDGRPLTPVLDRLAAEGFWFPDCFQQVAHGQTADAELGVNTSLYPLDSSVAAVTDADRTFPSLPRLLDDAGYDTMTFHADSLAFWNRDEFYPALGWQRSYSGAFFATDDKIGLWPSDDILFERTLRVLAARDASARPFCADIITVTSHYPFQLPADSRRPPTPSPPYAATLFGRYLQAMEYDDASIGRFIEGLKRVGLYDKSVIVIFGDHNGLPEPLMDADELAVASRFLGRKYTEADRANIPLLVLVPGAKGASGVKQVTAGQIDVLPTVSALLGLPYRQQVHFGRDVLAPGHAFLGLRSLGRAAYVDDHVLVVPKRNGTQAFDVVTKEETAPPVPDDLAFGQQRVGQLEELSDGYLEALPRR